jgi:PEP-CTERM motif
MNKHLTIALLLAGAGLLRFGGRSVEAQVFSLDAATAPANGAFPDNLYLAPGAGPPPVLLLPGAIGLPAGPPPPPPPSDVDALSFGIVFPGSHTVAGATFSVAPGSVGALGTAVFGESGGVGFLDEPADIFGSALLGGNVQVLDGDGIPSPGAAPSLGVVEPGSPVPGVSNTDAWDAGMPSPLGIYYSVSPADAAAHPVFAGTSAADIWFSPPVVGYSVMPALYAGSAALGLAAADNIDALAIIEDGIGGFSPGDTIYFSLDPASPSLLGLGASPADILVTTIGGIPAVAIPAGALGLLPGDNVDALHLFIVPEPSAFLLSAVGLFSLGWLGWRRRGRA